MPQIAGSSTKWDAATVEEKIRKIDALIHRPIQWDVIRQYQRQGQELTCELCGNQAFGRYWCRPCIHRGWCCECCILLGVPNYETAVFVL